MEAMTAPGFRPSARLRKLSTISLGGTEQSSNTWSTCASVKRNLLFCQRGPSLVPKETYTRVKRDLHSCQTSPTLLVTPVFKDLVYVLEAGRCERFSAVLCLVQPHNRRHFEHFEDLYVGRRAKGALVGGVPGTAEGQKFTRHHHVEVTILRVVVIKILPTARMSG